MTSEAMAKDSPTAKRGRGRQSKFTAVMSKEVKFLAEKGCTDADLAEFFAVSESTLNNWKISHPEFFEAMKEGKAVADAKVERSLFEKATGFSHPDSHVSNFQGTVTVTPVVKHYPPDTTACIFWLKNRKPQEWRDKTDVQATHTGEVKIVIGGNV